MPGPVWKIRYTCAREHWRTTAVSWPDWPRPARFSTVPSPRWKKQYEFLAYKIKLSRSFISFAEIALHIVTWCSSYRGPFGISGRAVSERFQATLGDVKVT